MSFTFAVILNRKLYIQLAFFLAVVFLAPQLYKTIHLFTDHHGHLDCEAFQRKASGFNAQTDHCPICKYHFTFFDTVTDQEDQWIKISFPEKAFQQPRDFFISPPAFHFLLRAPPAC